MSNKRIVLALVPVAILGAVFWYNSGRNSKHVSLSGSVQEGVGQWNTLSGEDIRRASSSQIIDLQNGQTLDLTITPVQKTIEGRTINMLGYNGSIPGPTLRIPEGAEVTIHLKNEGPVATTLHSHGVRMESAFDGVPGLTQKEIAPGESFAYTLKFPDPGIFWYHPHVRTDYAVEAGLYGNFIIVPNDTAYWPTVNREVPLMLDDIALDGKGALPFDDETANHTLMGRFGNVMLVNGETKYALEVKRGEVVRLYFTNAANARLFNVTLPGAKMKLVGADLGRYSKETMVDEILVAPGERRVVDVLFDKSGEYTLTHKTPGKQYALGKVSVSTERVATDYAKAFSVLRTNATVVKEMSELIDVYAGKASDKNIRLTLDMNGPMQNMMKSGGGHMGGGHMMPDGTIMGGMDMGMGDDGDAYEWEDTMAAMNRASTSKMMTWKLVDEKTGKINMDIDDWTFKMGEKVKIRIFNDPKSMHPMQHPIHFHGQRFVVLTINGMKNENPVWQDTTLIAKGDTADILLEASNPGNWMAHCHILEHAEAGMMLPFTVTSPE